VTEVLIIAGFLGFYGLVAFFGCALLQKLSTLDNRIDHLRRQNQALLQYHEEARSGLSKQPASLQVAVLGRKLLDVARYKQE